MLIALPLVVVSLLLAIAPAFVRRVAELAAVDRATSSLLAAFAAAPSLEEFRVEAEKLPSCAHVDIALAGVRALHRHDVDQVIEIATIRARRTWRPRLVAGAEVFELLAFAAPLAGLVISTLLVDVDQVLVRAPIFAGVGVGAIAWTLRAFLLHQVDAHLAAGEAFAAQLAESIERCKRSERLDAR